MRTITIDIIDDKALDLLRDLESLKVIKMRRDSTRESSDTSWSDYKGFMAKQSLEVVDHQLNELRKERE